VADIEAAEWDLVSRGVRQRVRAIEAFLADVYGRGRAFADGVVPWRFVLTSGKFRREAVGFAPQNGVRVHVAGIGLVRDERGGFRVLEDNVRAPSGVNEYPSRLLAALRAAASPGVADPLVVVLAPGPHTPGPHTPGPPEPEHALLARLMGVELVEGRDLFCYRNRVYRHTADGARRVDVIYRRVDDDWLDPMHFRPESRLGCPGLLNAARVGHVTIANAVGTGIAEDKRVCAHMADLIRYYLGAEPLLGGEESASAAVLMGERMGTRHIDLRVLAINDGEDVRVLPGGRAVPRHSRQASDR
jgi:uncharacterized circularly permuted ATP-grasp superfamily protein